MVRADLPSGLQVAQAVHAAFAFTHQHRDLVRPWLITSNYLIICSVADENALMDLITAAHTRQIERTAVREPDLDQQLTAVALAPGDPARRLCSNLPLALRQAAMA